MLLAPLKWVVQLVSWLPDLLRPGVFLALMILIVWFVFVQRGLPSLWAAMCRGAARLLDITVGVTLLPDYVISTNRAKRGESPTERALAIGGFVDRLLDGTASFYEGHEREPIEWKPVPWIPCVAVVAVLAVPWLAMEQAPASSQVRRDLAKAYGHWRDVEAWAEVDSSRRMSPGISWPPRPVARRTHRHARTMGVRLRCDAGETCRGRVILRKGAGRRVNTKVVAVGAHATRAVHIGIPKADARANRLSIRVARASR